MKIKPEAVRRAAMNKYAELQIFKLKVVIALALLVWLLQ